MIGLLCSVTMFEDTRDCNEPLALCPETKEKGPLAQRNKKHDSTIVDF